MQPARRQAGKLKKGYLVGRRLYEGDIVNAAPIRRWRNIPVDLGDGKEYEIRNGAAGRIKCPDRMEKGSVQ